MHIPKILFIAFVLPVTLFEFTYAQPANAKQYSIQKKVIGSKSAVVSAHPLASMAGLSVLKKGGNAFDAAIATQLALAVVYPGAGNIGGGGFMVAHLQNGTNITLDYREKAPGKASRDMYLDAKGEPQLNLSQQGQLASGVPGTIAGLFASMKYAKLPFATLIQPAIILAEKGFAITASQAASFNSNKKDFLTLNTAAVAFVKEKDWKAGDILVQKELAATLKRIRDQGQKGFYEGKTARLIVAEMQKGNGIISLEDLKNYKAVERAGFDFNYKNYRIITMPLPSSGGIILQQMMKMIEDRNIAAMGFQTAASVQLMTEVERRAFADRGEYLGDPDFVKVPVNTLVSDAYLKERMKDYEPGKAGNSKTTSAGIIKESEETTHISIVDEYGNAVAVTTTLNDSYGSKTVVAGAGFLLNNEMDDFSVKPGVPNMYGAIGNDKNAIAPGKRMLSSMTPTIVLKNGSPYLVVGSPGGTTIPTSVFQTLVNVLEFNMTPEDAVNKPKFHHQWLPDLIDVEKDFPDAVKKQLQDMGYTLKERSPIGRTELIQVKEAANSPRVIIAIGDKRGDDDARGR
ncbi:MAG TPA: gamma-glutamyltransferase [Ferruginibacter sp.]|mgnify:CR=1 FL=1|nr:gamma-glutamyltransferase [Chitinophagaceae bacterium]HQW92265.1 gamma-glutamyltransferase [Ferruginibacter sp.]